MDKLPQRVLNLRKLWDKKKHSFEYTQTTAAKELGWTQGAFSQYLNAITDLNDSAIIKLANFLDVDPLEIDPQFEERAGVRWRQLPFATSLTGINPVPAGIKYFDHRILTKSQLIYADIDFPPVAEKGSYLLVCHEKFIAMQSRLSNLKEDLWGVFKRHKEAPWELEPYLKIPLGIDKSLTRIVVATIWI